MFAPAQIKARSPSRETAPNVYNCLRMLLVPVNLKERPGFEHGDKLND